MRGRVHHVDLSVCDPHASRPFYDLVLGHMGYRCVREAADTIDYGHAGAAFPGVAIRRTKGPNATRPHDRYAPGLHHLAFEARDRANVDALYAKLVDCGARILDPPSEYPEYDDRYYAVFFMDPDGLKLEFVVTD